MRFLVQDTNQGRTSRKMLLFDQGESLYVVSIFTVRRLILLCHDAVCVCTFKLFLLKIWLFLCVCIISTAKQIVFLNHRNRQVVGGTNNVLIHYADDYSPNLSGVVLCNPFICNILLLFINFLVKNLVVCVRASTAEQIRHTQCSSTLCGWLCTQPIWCGPLQPFQMRYIVVH